MLSQDPDYWIHPGFEIHLANFCQLCKELDVQILFDMHMDEAVSFVGGGGRGWGVPNWVSLEAPGGTSKHTYLSDAKSVRELVYIKFYL